MFFCWKVRAGSLQDLVYKGGQAGITKASVTLTFDNRDRKQSPLGYEQYEEITVTRQVRCISVVTRYQDWLGNLFGSIYEWNSSVCVKSSFTKSSVLYESWNTFSFGCYVLLQFIKENCNWRGTVSYVLKIIFLSSITRSCACFWNGLTTTI